MSAKIRLFRLGTKKKPYYRVVVMDESSARNAATLDTLGFYDPRKEPVVFDVDAEKTKKWLSNGAIPSDTVRKYLGKAGIMSELNFANAKKRAPKKQQAAPEAPPAA